MDKEERLEAVWKFCGQGKKERSILCERLLRMAF